MSQMKKHLRKSDTYGLIYREAKICNEYRGYYHCCGNARKTGAGAGNNTYCYTKKYFYQHKNLPVKIPIQSYFITAGCLCQQKPVFQMLVKLLTYLDFATYTGV